MRIVGITGEQLDAVLERFNRTHKTSIHLSEHGSWKNGPMTGGVRRPWVQGQFKLHGSGDRYHRRGIPLSQFANGEPTKVPKRMPYVCWHGYRDLFRAVFAKYPQATIRTGETTYKGREHFERTYQDTDRNIGSLVSPFQYSEACDCKENGCDWIGLAERIRYNRKVQRIMGPVAVNQS